MEGEGWEDLGWVALVSVAVLLGGCDKSKKQDPSSKPGGSAVPVLTAVAVKSAPFPASTMPKSDKGRLTARAKKILIFCQNKDVEALVEMVPPKDKENTKESMKPEGAGYKSFFGKDSWRWKTIEAWDEKVAVVRVNGDRAQVKFGEVEKKEAAVVEFVKVDGIWYFSDIKSPSLDEYGKWGTPAQ